MRRFWIQTLGFLVILTISIGSIKNPYTHGYIEDLKGTTMAVANMETDLYSEISEKAKSYEVPAQDAQIHRVWKAIPGYNGLTVDIGASYKKMKNKKKFEEDLLVYKQVPPKIHLSDLPPQPIYRGHEDKPMVSFLINVAWGNEYLPDMLDVLNKHHVKATFFLEGRWVKENPDMARMIHDAGHLIGNHSYSHPDMSKLTREQIIKQLKNTNEIIKATTGVDVNWFAPPSGSFRQEVVDIADDMGMKTLLWSVDTVDWKKPQPSVLVDRVMKKVHNGGMILMHPTAPTASSLETLIIAIKEKGYSLGSVSSLLDEERISGSNNTEKH
ncbi:polysaccharide deacetylase family protein [Metabacillus arenae]|uniref:Polysaccharide deacetylase family protein n=1 Tax=Metabacillus arenae TaxID=2771434 RepID=A0A926RWY3_9BACI|nr:polysaccharide deacetylase family protein [Metabacillus arenae]MBD1380060.1 polysaccharide deacetylase family protein [Metabacillus arenae]